MDMTESIQPRSDQLNADDLVGGPQTFTIVEVVEGRATHPFDFVLEETPGRVYRPSKGQRRVIVQGWGSETSTYAGRRLTLFREPEVKYAGVDVGGIRISHMSHLAGPMEVALTVAKSKRVAMTVHPLAESAPPATQHREPTAADVAACTDIAVLGNMWRACAPDSERRPQIEARVAELTPQTTAGSETGTPSAGEAPAEATDPAVPQTGGAPVERETSDGAPSTSPAVEPTPAPQDDPAATAQADAGSRGPEESLPSGPPSTGEALAAGAQTMEVTAHFQRLGVADKTEQAFTMSVLIGRQVESKKDLRISEAAGLLAKLESFRDSDALQAAVIAADETAAC
jgi:hypothetical protein